MAVVKEYALPKGNAGMTKFGDRNDDSTVTLPDIGFDFRYNGSVVRKIYINGNSWVGFNSSSEQLKINRRDTSYNKLFYSNEIEYGVKLFRVRFEGNSSYSSWGSNNLIWEVSIFETGVIRVVIENFPNNGSNSFANPGVGTVTLKFEQGKSYIFTPENEEGKNYVIEEGSYIPCTSKYLLVDSEGVKTYADGEQAKWVIIGQLPLTEDMFKTHGIETVPASRIGIKDNAPTLYYYTDSQEVLDHKVNYTLRIAETTTSRRKKIIQNYDFNIHEGKSINRFEVIFRSSKKDAKGNEEETDGKMKIALSVDGGENWLTYNKETSGYEKIDINNEEEFIANGINPSSVLDIDYDGLNSLIEASRKLRVAYIFEKPSLEDVCKLRKFKIFYNEG